MVSRGCGWPAPGKVVLVGTEGLAGAPHVGGRVHAADGGGEGHKAPATVLPYLAVHQVPSRECICRLGQHLRTTWQLDILQPIIPAGYYATFLQLACASQNSSHRGSTQEAKLKVRCPKDIRRGACLHASDFAVSNLWPMVDVVLLQKTGALSDRLLGTCTSLRWQDSSSLNDPG